MILDSFVRSGGTCDVADPATNKWLEFEESNCCYWITNGAANPNCSSLNGAGDWFLRAETQFDKSYLIWNDNWTDDQEVSARLIDVGCAAFPNGQPTTLAARINSCAAVGTTGNPSNDKISAYYIQTDIVGVGVLNLYRMFEGVETLIGSFSVGASWCADGAVWKRQDILILRAVGTTISVIREKGPRWGAAEGDTDTWISVTDSFISNGKGGWVQNRLDISANHCCMWQDFSGVNLGTTVSGGLCGGSISVPCPPGSDREEDGFEREILFRPPTYPWVESFDSSEITSPFSLASTAISIITPVNRFLRIRSSMVSPTRSPRGYLIWNNPAVTDDHFSEATLIGWQQPNFSNLSPTSLAVRLTPGAAWNAQTGYVIGIDPSVQGNTLKLYRIDNLVLTLLGTVVSLSAAEDDVFQLSVTGDLLLVTKNQVEILTAVDATYPTGKPGFAQFTTPVNWGSLGLPDSTVLQDFDTWGGGVCGEPNVALRKDLPCGCSG